MKILVNKAIGIMTGLLFIYFLSGCSTKADENKSSNHIGKDKETITNVAIKKAGKNSDQIIASIENCSDEQLEGLYFLLENMPERDLKSLSKKFLLENVVLSYKVLDSVKWGKNIPTDIFLNYVLPYVNLHERRDNWRLDFLKQFLPLVKNYETTSEALIKLNSVIWDIVNVHYSTKRPKADQSPYESIEAGLASCTGLSILLIDVCRSVGIPARFVGVPLWKDHSGNHSWIEIWDNGWHFVGAGEPGPLDDTWFGKRAILADDSNWKYSIYATSFKKTNVIFPPLFDSTATYVFGDIITENYNKKISDDGLVTLAIRLYNHKDGERIKGNITVENNGSVIGRGETKDEKHDFNDFLIFRLNPMQNYKIVAESNGVSIEKEISTDDAQYQFCELVMSN